MNATHMIPIVALAALALAAPASAAGFDFAIDFDTDGDPATIQGTVEASVGDIVEAYLVVDDFPTPWPMLWAALFGLDGTDGLELIGLFGTQPDRGGMLTDGPEESSSPIRPPSSAMSFPRSSHASSSASRMAASRR